MPTRKQEKERKCGKGEFKMPASLFSFSREELVSEVMNTLCLSVTSSGVEVRIYNGGGKLLDELHDFLLPITISWQGYYLLNIEAVG